MRFQRFRGFLFASSLLLVLAPVATHPAADPSVRTPAHASRTGSSRTQSQLSHVADDPRVDLHLRAIFNTAEANRALLATALLPDLPAPDAGSEARPLVSVDYGRATPESLVDLLIEGTMDPDQLEAIGVSVNTRAGQVVTAQAPIELLGALLSVPGVRHVQAASQLQQSLDVSALEINADEIWQGTPPQYPGWSGQGVVVGVVDKGFDLAHMDFRTAQNKTRVKYVWHQTASGTPPSTFTYGAEYTEAMINAGQVTTVSDADGHGTHVAGVATGNGRATGNSQPAFRYVGIAPEADLVVVVSPLLETYVIDAVNYVFRKAAALGKPAVVNLSLSSLTGDRNGAASLDIGISNLTGPGKLVSAAAGNYGDKNLHARLNVGASQTQTVQFSIPTYTERSLVLGAEYVRIEAWHDATASFKAKLRSPHGHETTLVNPGQSVSDFITPDGTISLSNAVITNPKGGKLILFYINHLTDVTAHPAAGTWTITLTRVSGSSTGICDFWVSNWLLGTTTWPVFTTSADQYFTVAPPATGDSVIASGAYTTKTQWINGSGATSYYTGAPPIGTVAPWSSKGPRRDGVQRPDVIAPGYGVSAALSAASAPNVSIVFKMLDQVHRIAYGTSRAAGHTTGALALLLEQYPNLTPAAARRVLIDMTRSDSFTGVVPNWTCGHGKLDMMGGDTVAVGDGVDRFSFSQPFPNPSQRLTSFSFALGAEDLRGPGGPQLRIVDVRGRIVRWLPVSAVPGRQLVSWDGHDPNDQPVPGGVYFAHLRAGENTSVRKFVWIGP